MRFLRRLIIAVLSTVLISAISALSYYWVRDYISNPNNRSEIMESTQMQSLEDQISGMLKGVVGDKLPGLNQLTGGAKTKTKSKKTATGLIKLTDGETVEPKTHDFLFERREYSVKPEVNMRVYHGAVKANRLISIRAGENQEDRYARFYKDLTCDPAMDEDIDALAKGFRTIKAKYDLSASEYVEFLAKYVQTMPYDMNRATANITGSLTTGDPRMPVQTLVDGKGDCDEKVMLLASLLRHEGYGVAGFLFIKEKHMSLGVKSEGDGYKSTGYEFIETTGPAYVSEVPEKFIGGVELTSDPQVIVLGKGKKDYSADAVKDVAHIIEVRDSAMAAAKEKKAAIESTPLSKEDFERESAQYKQCFVAYNTLRTTVDTNGNPVGVLKDRVVAVDWIAKNCWW